MKKLIALLSIGLVASCANVFGGLFGDSVYGETQFYAAMRGGALWLDGVDGNYLDTGYLITGSVGLQMPLCDIMNDPTKVVDVRIELESGYGANSKDGFNANLVPVLVNVLVDVPITEKLYLFAGVGGGLAMLNGDIEEHTLYMVQARGGLGYKLNEVIAIEIGYRLAALQFKEPLMQSMEGGLVFRF